MSNHLVFDFSLKITVAYLKDMIQKTSNQDICITHLFIYYAHVCAFLVSSIYLIHSCSCHTLSVTFRRILAVTCPLISRLVPRFCRPTTNRTGLKCFGRTHCRPPHIWLLFLIRSAEFPSLASLWLSRTQNGVFLIYVCLVSPSTPTNVFNQCRLPVSDLVESILSIVHAFMRTYAWL